MRLIVPHILVIIPCCCFWLAACQQQWTYRDKTPTKYGDGGGGYRLLRPSTVYDPLEVVEFELMAEPATTTTRGQSYNNYNGRNFGGRNKYDMLVEPPVMSSSSNRGRSRSRLPLLSRGERGLDEDDDEDEEYLLMDEEEEQEPSCQELRRMWRIARRIHNRAIKTNKIPQQAGHAFAEFESDR